MEDWRQDIIYELFNSLDHLVNIIERLEYDAAAGRSQTSPDIDAVKAAFAARKVLDRIHEKLERHGQNERP